MSQSCHKVKENFVKWQEYMYNFITRDTITKANPTCKCQSKFLSVSQSQSMSKSNFPGRTCWKGGGGFPQNINSVHDVQHYKADLEKGRILNTEDFLPHLVD